MEGGKESREVEIREQSERWLRERETKKIRVTKKKRKRKREKCMEVGGGASLQI